MTQEKESTLTPGAQSAPAKDAAQAKKKPAAARKPAKTTTAKKQAAAAATAEKPAAKKPRATAKSATEKPAADTPAKAAKAPVKTAKSKAAPAKKTETAQPQTAPAHEPKPAAEKAKAPAKAPKTAKSVAATAKKTTPAKKTAPKTTAAKTSAAAPTPVLPPVAAPAAAPAPASVESTDAAPAKAKQARPNQRARSAAAKRNAREKSAETPATPPATAKVSEPAPAAAETKAAPEPSAEAQAQPGERQAQPGEGQTARPSSRRSRRGGRRRNKAKAAAQAAEANGATAAIPESARAEQPAAEEQPVVEVAEIEAPAEPKAAKAGTPAKPAQGKAKGKGREKARKQETADSETDADDDIDIDTKASSGKKSSSGKRKMFISVLSGELVEVVLAEDGVVLEYYVEMLHQAKVKGNIYKGTVSNIDANLQAAFISYAGGVKNGFLQIDEVHPEYYLSHQDPAKNRKFPPIQKILKPGQEILVQVVKEPAGTKGAFLTSYLSLPGRFLVLTPGREQIGVSRKVDNDEERSRLRGMLEGLTPGKGLGVIVRTVSEGASKTSLQRDLQFLKRLWKEVRGKGQTAAAPSLIYEELDLSTRAVRDYLTDDVTEVWVDDATTAKQVTELASLLFPKKQNLVQVHGDSGSTLFERFSLQKQLDQINSREVSLPSGGRLVFDNTEALTAIDINSGRSSGKSNFEDMAFRTNLDAANAIPLQLRLRDIGGQVVVDFIEMRDRNHWRDVEKAVRNGMKGDRARYDVGKIGPFGMLEIVRQRLGSSAISVSTEPCPCCKGTGVRRNMEWQAMRALRDIHRHLRQASANKQASLTYHAETELAVYLLNAKRVMLQNLEEEAGVSLTVLPTPE